jgi:HPt (histidine-containing phosphotransfer) domain-containing protein
MLTRWLPQRTPGELSLTPPDVPPASLVSDDNEHDDEHQDEHQDEMAILEESQLAQIRALGRAGSPNPLTRVIQLYLDNAPSQIEALRTAIAANDAAQIRAMAHALKSASATLGALIVVSACQDLESMGREQRLENAVTAFTHLEQAFAEACVALTALPEAPK